MKIFSKVLTSLTKEESGVCKIFIIFMSAQEPKDISLFNIGMISSGSQGLHHRQTHFIHKCTQGSGRSGHGWRPYFWRIQSSRCYFNVPPHSVIIQHASEGNELLESVVGTTK